MQYCLGENSDRLRVLVLTDEQTGRVKQLHIERAVERAEWDATERSLREDLARREAAHAEVVGEFETARELAEVAVAEERAASVALLSEQGQERARSLAQEQARCDTVVSDLRADLAAQIASHEKVAADLETVRQATAAEMTERQVSSLSSEISFPIEESSFPIEES